MFAGEDHIAVIDGVTSSTRCRHCQATPGAIAADTVQRIRAQPPSTTVDGLLDLFAGAVPAGRTGTWGCAGAPPGGSRPASSSAASTDTCTCQRSAPHSMCVSRHKLSVLTVMMNP
jgi:hypothetical protein